MKRRLPHRRLSLQALSTAFGLATWGCYAAPALAVCPSQDFSVLCNPVLIGDVAPLTQADIDNETEALTDGAWLLDGPTVLSLPAGGNYTPGLPAGLSVPTIFITENATLRLEDLGTDGVDLNASIVLCDAGTLDIRDSELRFGSTDNITFALDNSEVVLAGATLSGLGAGATTQVFSDTARLTATPTTLPSVRSGSGSINWHFGGASTASVDQAQFFATVGIGSTANVTLSNSSYVELLMESCEGDVLALDGVPDACDVDANCFGAGHPLTDYSRPAPFAAQVTESQVYAWRTVSHPGSTTTLDSVPTDANLVVELTGDFGISALTFPPGEVPEGLDDRTVEVADAEIYAWTVTPDGDSELAIQPGSELGGLTCSGEAVCSVVGTTFIDGAAVENRGQATLLLDTSTVSGDVLNAGARAELVDSTLGGVLTMIAPTWLANTSYVAADVDEPGVFHIVELDTPLDGATVESGMEVEVSGSVFALDADAAVVPFPAALVELRDLSDDELTVLATIESTAEDATLATWDTSVVAPGEYEISLRFDASQVAVARRQVTVTAAGGATTTGEGSSSDSGVGTGSSSGSSMGSTSDTTSGGPDSDGADSGSSGAGGSTGGGATTSDTATDSTTGSTLGSTSDGGADPTAPSETDTRGDADTEGAEGMSAEGGCQVGSARPTGFAWMMLCWLCLAGRRRGAQRRAHRRGAWAR